MLAACTISCRLSPGKRIYHERLALREDGVAGDEVA